MGKFLEMMSKVDEQRAIRLRKEYGRVNWLVSWEPFEPDEFADMWLARLSCPSIDETVERIGQSRCLAIDAATRHLLDLLQRQSMEDSNRKSEYLKHTNSDEEEGLTC